MSDPENPFDEFPTYNRCREQFHRRTSYMADRLDILNEYFREVKEWVKKWGPITVEWLKCRAYFKDLEHAKDCYIKSTKWDELKLSTGISEPDILIKVLTRAMSDSVRLDKVKELIQVERGTIVFGGQRIMLDHTFNFSLKYLRDALEDP